MTAAHERGKAPSSLGAAGPTAARLRRTVRRAAIFLSLALAFAAAYGQAPLYSSNQNTYFAHGLASAGLGHLRDDWFAKTKDPTPLFSELVRLTYLALPEWTFHLHHALLGGVYFVSLLTIVGRWRKRRGDLGLPWRATVAASTALVVSNSSMLAEALRAWTGQPLTKHLHGGLAGQYVLGPVFQPSAFGVFLLASIALFVCRRPYAAVVSAALAAAFHPTYVLGAALLVTSYAALALRHGQGARHALRMAGLAAALLSPTVAYVLVSFPPAAGALHERAQTLLAHGRIPHHALPERWFDAISAMQLALVALALWLVRTSVLFPIVLVPTLTALGLTLVQLATGSAALALLFPWRVSVFVVPLAAAVVLGWLVELALAHRRGRLVAALLVGATLVPIGKGAIAMAAVVRPSKSTPMLDFVRATKRRGDVYVVPLGSERFRLATGAPIVVDHKSNPYEDTEVLEWDERLALVRKFYRTGDCRLLGQLARRYRATHVVFERTRSSPDCGGAWQEVHGDARHRVMRLVRR